MSRIQLELCLHPTCRKIGVQACIRGLCCECYRVLMRAMRNPENRLSEAQLIADGRILPKGFREYRHAEMDYGERIDWFLEGQKMDRQLDDHEAERRMWGRLNYMLGEGSLKRRS